jgi:hypothetical protein
MAFHSLGGLASNTLGSAPQPAYFARRFRSSMVASRFAASIDFRVRMAARLA